MNTPKLKDLLRKLPKDQAEQALRKLLANQYKQSLYLTAKHLLAMKDVNRQTHGPIIHALESETKRKMIVVPRGCLKSSIACVAYPIWLLINNPNKRIMIDSELFTNSKTFLREIKQHLSAPDMTTLFGEFKTKATWAESEIIIAQRTAKLKEASITCSGIGATKVGQHYDCLHPQSLVYTSNGYVMARDLRKGLRVYGSDGSFHSIVFVQHKISSKEMIGIRPKFQSKTNWVTQDHKILVFRNHQLVWIEATQILKSDSLAIPLNKGQTRAISRSNPNINKLLSSPNIWRLIGYWLAEGCKSDANPNGIRLCFNANEDSYLSDVKHIVQTELGVPCSISKRTKSNTKLIIFSSVEMKSILNKFGSMAKDKYLPPFALNATKSNQRELVRGYFAGDGCYSNGVVSFCSISHDLLTGLQLILAGMNIPSSLSKAKDALIKTIHKNQRPSYCNETFNLTTTHYLAKLMLGLDSKLPTRPYRSFFTDKYWMVPVAQIIRKPYCGEVVDLEVADVHDFYMPGMIAHNCIIMDDMNGAQNSGTPEACQKVVDHYRGNMSILEPDGTLVVIGTRWSELDLIGFILREELRIHGDPKYGSYELDYHD